MRGRSRRTGVALAIGAAIAGCGGGGGADLSSPRATARTYLAAVGRGDARAACDALAPKLRAQAVRTARAAGIDARTCTQVFSQVYAHLSADQRRKFLDAKVTKVSVSGAVATVTVAGASATPTLAKTGGRWLITGGVGF